MSPTQTSHQTVRIGRGRHQSPADGVCVMELASMLAGESFSDHPEAVCPVIGAFLRAYNDTLPDHLRQDLYGYAARVVGTRAGRAERSERRRMCAEWLASTVEAPPLRCVWRRTTTWCGGLAGRVAAMRAESNPRFRREALDLLDAMIAVGANDEAWGSAACDERLCGPDRRGYARLP